MSEAAYVVCGQYHDGYDSITWVCSSFTDKKAASDFHFILALLIKDLYIKIDMLENWTKSDFKGIPKLYQEWFAQHAIEGEPLDYVPEELLETFIPKGLREYFPDNTDFVDSYYRNGERISFHIDIVELNKFQY